uniref:Uncharacterized protein n=1 Tax=Panagrolaimus davidi TaxID=227884 RepID=A0A914Q922_9BILA
MSSKNRDSIGLFLGFNNLMVFNVETLKWKNYELFGEIKSLNPTIIFNAIKSAFNLQKLKALIFTIMDSQFSSFKEAYNFRLKCKEFCEKNEIFHFSSVYTSIQSLIATTFTKTLVNKNDEIFAIFPSEKKQAIRAEKLIGKNGQYQVVEIIDIFDVSSFDEECKEKILKNSNPKKIIFLQMSPDELESNFFSKCKEMFEKDKFSVEIPTKTGFEYARDAYVIKVLHLMDEMINPYNVTIHCQNKFAVICDGIPLITVKDRPVLPFEESVIIDFDLNKIVSVSFFINIFSLKGCE